MRIKIKYIFNILLIVFFVLIINADNAGAATVNLPWSTTFNCADWTESSATWYSLNCDNLAGAGFDFCSDSTGSHPTQITSLANNSGGSGGSGLRTLNGDGKDNSSGSLKISFTSRQNELWVSWAMRYEAGFAWNPGLYYDKWLYFDVGDTCAVVPEWYGADTVNIWTACGQNYQSASGNGWNTIMGGSVSDGQYHNFKLHMKMDTNGSNGVAEMWVDGVKRISATNVNFGGGAGKIGWGWFNLSSNQNSVGNNNICKAVDFDDFMVSVTDTSDSIAPTAPTNLAAVAISSSQINLSWTASTDNIGVVGYKIYRNGTQIATSVNNFYSDISLAASITYSYIVSAYDAAGNNSNQSNSVSATTQADTTPPSAPSGLVIN